MIANVMAETQPEYIANMNLERYRYANQSSYVLGRSCAYYFHVKEHQI